MTSIEQVIAKLRRQVQLDIQHSWRDITLLDKDNLDRCPRAPVNDKNYLVFPKGKQIWLAQKITVPQTLQGYPLSGLSLRLGLTWWAQSAQIFVDGVLVQQGDLFDSSARVLIIENAQPEKEYLVTIRLVSPNHDIGALMRSHLVYETDLQDNIDPGLVADELSVLHKYITQFAPEHLETLAGELNKFDWHNLENADKFDCDLTKLRSSLLPLAKDIKQRCFNLLGHAHLDMAWLWTSNETYEVAERTFKSVLKLQQDFPNLTFGHTSPALYQWIQTNRPQLFKQIQTAVESNKWEILGGMWIEPETNLVSGESLIRQLLYGQQYYQQQFGKISTVAWLPDSFGFTWQLPQIMQQCGIEYFVTGKLHWNDTTKFAHGCFWWESPDGTRLLTLMSPPNVTGVMDTNPITMTDYAIAWENQTGLQDIFWLPGVGDHGGGPTRDMLEVAAKWDDSPFFPEIKFSTAVDYLNRVSQCPDFPVWQDELYLELHRGCYTVHADQKKYNRYCERLLYEAELWATLATLLCKDRLDMQPIFPIINIILERDFCQADWQQLIEIAWKKVLFNQFHDILPGTSIPEVFNEANRDWEAAIEIGEKVLQSALTAIANNINLPNVPPDAKAIVIFNSLNWQRSQLVSVPTENKYGRVLDLRGNSQPCQINSGQLIFLATVSSVGYSVYWLVEAESDDERQDIPQGFTLENDYLTATIDRHTGNLNSVYDKQQQREILAQPVAIQAFVDKGQYWDAWNIDPEYEKKQLNEPKLTSIAWLENGPLRQKIRVVLQLNKSEFIQDYILENHSPILKIANTVDWQETQVMVKVAFNFKLNSDRVTYEIPCGAIERTTQPQTAAEKAKWEVSGLNWADITEKEYGVSLLNDSKYGYDAQNSRLRLTLLRSSVWPDPQSDRGIHHFTYAIYPHKNSWREALTVQKGYELNTQMPMVIVRQYLQKGELLPSRSELLNLSADNLILTALKLSENRELILRCYEAHGREVIFQLKSDLNLQSDKLLDCLERNTDLKVKQGDRIEPYKIVTLRLSYD
jgi:alpha-mannosidase